jgi:hypothetical protein
MREWRSSPIVDSHASTVVGVKDPDGSDSPCSLCSTWIAGEDEIRLELQALFDKKGVPKYEFPELSTPSAMPRPANGEMGDVERSQ